jgi:aryl sulfotransferase
MPRARLNLLVSYPKSGNTWFRAVLSSVRGHGKDVDINAMSLVNSADRLTLDRILDIRTSDFTQPEAARLRPLAYEAATAYSDAEVVLKVHDAWLPTFADTPMPFPPDLIRRVILIVRDPRDVASSFAAHMGLTLEQAIVEMNNPTYLLARPSGRLPPQLTQRLSTWSEHTRSWMEAQGLAIHVVRYEDMQARPHRTFRAALDFLDAPVPDEVLDAALTAARFDRLKAQEAEHGFRERSKVAKSFFREGRSGGWRETLSPQQADRIAADHRTVMTTLGYLDAVPAVAAPA